MNKTFFLLRIKRVFNPLDDLKKGISLNIEPRTHHRLFYVGNIKLNYCVCD